LANITEEAGGFKLAIALPGFSKEDLSIKLDKNKLIVSADIKSEDEVKYKLKEFAYDKFSRTFMISPKVDKAKIKASMTNGILYVNLPKRAEEKDVEAHNIEIS
jgi:HSP20 family protein